MFVLLVTRSAYAMQLPTLDTLAIPQDSNGECRWMLKAFNLPIVVIALGLPSPIILHPDGTHATSPKNNNITFDFLITFQMLETKHCQRHNGPMG